MNTLLRTASTARSLLGLIFLAGGLIACTTQEDTSTITATGGTTTPTGGATGGLGTLCPAPKELLSDFTYTPSDAGPVDPRIGTSGSLEGGGSYYPNSGAHALTSDLSQDNWHLTGTVGDYSGFGLYFYLCDRIDASAFSGISFTVSGNVPSITFGIGTVDNTPTGEWMLTTGGKTTAKATDSGRCTPSSGTQYYHPGCTDNTTQIPVTATPTTQTVAWGALSGGAPSTSVNPAEITTIYWFFPWSDQMAPYELDFTIDDLKFIP